MNATGTKDKGHGPAQKVKSAVGRQAVGLGAAQIDGQHHLHRAVGRGMQDADAARLDPAPDRIGRVRDDARALAAQDGAVIGHQRRAESHHFKGQRGLSRTRRTQDQQPLVPIRDAACMQDHGAVAVVVWEWSLRPHTGEVGSLTPIQFPWFNTQVREMRGAVTLPVEIGIAGFGDNIGGTANSLRRMVLQAAACALAGLVLGLGAALAGRTPAPRRLIRRLRRLLPNTKARALRDAAKAGDLMALRAAAEAFVMAEARLGRRTDPAPLRALDEALFRAGPAGEFDRRDFLRRMMRRQRGTTDPDRALADHRGW